MADEDVINYAIRGGHIELAKKIHSSIEEWKRGDFDEYVEEHGCAIRTDLISIARSGYLEKLKNNIGDSAVCWNYIGKHAAGKGHLDIVKYAVENGADPHHIIGRAIKNYRMNIIHYLENFAIKWSCCDYWVDESPFKDVRIYIRDKVNRGK